MLDWQRYNKSLLTTSPAWPAPEVPAVPIESVMKTAINFSNGILVPGDPGLDNGQLQLVHFPAPNPDVITVDESEDERAEGQTCHDHPVAEDDSSCVWSLGGSLFIPGLKHSLDNLSADLTKQMTKFKDFQSDLSKVNTLLHQKYYRDRVKKLMVGTPFVRLFASHKPGSLAMWRWGSLVECCSALHSLEGALRTHWCLKKFLSVRETDDDKANNQLFSQADRAIRSNFFWAYLRFILLIHGVLHDLSSWMEGCTCHHHSKTSCCLRSRRSPELASGVFDEFLNDTFSTASSMFAAVAAGLGEGSREWEMLCNDWNKVCDVAVAELRIKTSHWGQLPYILCGMGMPDPEKGRAAARRALQLYESDSDDAMVTLARRHPMVQRFLKRGEELRHLVDDWLLGADLAEPDMLPLRQWIGGLRLVRIAERATEEGPV
jgi:hypothetical protein